MNCIEPDSWTDITSLEELYTISEERLDMVVEHAAHCPFHSALLDEMEEEVKPLLEAALPDKFLKGIKPCAPKP